MSGWQGHSFSPLLPTTLCHCHIFRVSALWHTYADITVPAPMWTGRGRFWAIWLILWNWALYFRRLPCLHCSGMGLVMLRPGEQRVMSVLPLALTSVQPEMGLLKAVGNDDITSPPLYFQVLHFADGTVSACLAATADATAAW